MLGIELLQWCQLPRPTGWQKRICFFVLNCHLWLDALGHVLPTRTSSVISQRSSKYLFFFKFHRRTSYIQFCSVLLKLLTQQLYGFILFFLDFGDVIACSWNFHRNNRDLGQCLVRRVWLTIWLSKCSIFFSHKCVCFVWRCLLSLIGRAWFDRFSLQITHIELGCSPDDINPKNRNLHCIGSRRF
jgi:hypothetical protein